jgi:hypothetical protein
MVAHKGLGCTPALALLSVVVLFNYFKPSEPFLVPYLTSVKRLSERQVCTPRSQGLHNA